MTNLEGLIARLRYEDAAPSELWGLDAAEVMRLAADAIEALATEGGSDQERARRRYLKDKLAAAQTERDRYRAALEEIAETAERCVNISQGALSARWAAGYARAALEASERKVGSLEVTDDRSV